MTATSKYTTGILVIIVLGLGVWFYKTHSSNVPVAVLPAAQTTTTQAEPQTETSNAASGATVSTTGTSDAALNADMANVDTEMTGLNSDNASADSGLSSQ